MQEAVDILEPQFSALSPYSAHAVVVDGVAFKTAEHAYQALRSSMPFRERIENAPTPEAAWQEGQRAKEQGGLIAGYDKVALMEMILRAKYTQHADVRDTLRATHRRNIIKALPADAYWGTGKSREGKNMLGKLWMKIRDEAH